MAYAWSPGPIEPVDPHFWEPVNPAAMRGAQRNASMSPPRRGTSRDRPFNLNERMQPNKIYDEDPRKTNAGDSMMSEYEVDMSMSLKPVLFDTPPRVMVKSARPASMFGHPKILDLDKDNFYDAILSKEKALVMYSDSRVPRNTRLDLDFIRAADTTNNEKYQFGFVDCLYNKPFCMQQKICKVPTLKLYSNGFEVSKMEDMTHINANHILQIMEMTPVLKLPRQTLHYNKMLDLAQKASLNTITEASLDRTPERPKTKVYDRSGGSPTEVSSVSKVGFTTAQIATTPEKKKRSRFHIGIQCLGF